MHTSTVASAIHVYPCLWDTSRSTMSLHCSGVSSYMFCLDLPHLMTGNTNPTICLKHVYLLRTLDVIHKITAPFLLHTHQRDILEPLDLSPFACSQIQVSFAVISQHGSSTYSPAASVSVSGGESLTFTGTAFIFFYYTCTRVWVYFGMCSRKHSNCCFSSLRVVDVRESQLILNSWVDCITHFMHQVCDFMVGFHTYALL